MLKFDYKLLKEGQVFKNYKELCKHLKVPKYAKIGGDFKKSVMRQIGIFFDYEKVKSEIRILKLKENPDFIKPYNEIEYQMNMPEEDYSKSGVYQITQGNKIYIGSTTVSFRKRITGHRKGVDSDAKAMIKNGGVMKPLWVTSDDDKDSKIREVEMYYIDKVVNDGEKVLINKHKHAWINNRYSDVNVSLKYRNLIKQKQHKLKMIPKLHSRIERYMEELINIENEIHKIKEDHNIDEIFNESTLQHDSDDKLK